MLMKNIKGFVMSLALISGIIILNSCESESINWNVSNSDAFYYKTNTQRWGIESNGLEYGTRSESTRTITQQIIPIEGESGLYLEETRGEDFGEIKTLKANSGYVTRAQIKDEVPTDNTFKIVAYYNENGTEKAFFGKDGDNNDIIRDVAFDHRDDVNDINYWKLTGEDQVFWKLGSQAITSYAWWPTDLSFNTSTKTFSYEVSTDPLNQTDFLYSYVPPTYYTVQESAPITFNHALTAVQFVMGQGFSASNGQTGPGKVVKIELKNLYYKGVFNPQTGTWVVDETATRDFTLNIANPSEMTEEQQNIVLNPDVYTFLMLPQNLGDNPCEAIFTMADNRVFRASLNQAGIWSPGSAVRYRLAGDISNGYVVVAYSNEGDYQGGETGSISVCSYQLRGARPYAQAWKVTGFSIDQGLTWNSPEAEVWTGKDASSGAALTPVEAWITDRDLTGTTDDDHATNYATLNLTLNKSVVTSRTGKGADINSTLKQTNKGSTRIDLSEYDPHGVKLSTAESSNGYVVSGYGFYKFPAAYGKALRGGNAYTSAYNQSNFVNYKGNKINQPYVQDDTGVIPTEVRIVWQEGAIEGAIKNLSYNSSTKYISFDVDKDYICQGNAVIGIYDSQGLCMWSWHIWISSIYTNNPDIKSGSYQFTPEIFGIVYLGGDLIYSNRSVMLRIQQVDDEGNVKIGTSSCKIMVSQGAGEENNMGVDMVYYQWGRKDAVPCVYNWSNPSSGTSGGRVPATFSNNNPSFNTPWTTGSSQISMPDAIRHPELFKNGSEFPNYDWNSVSYYNWYNSQATSSYNASLTAYTKTVYDPSPPGYHVPLRSNFVGLSSVTNSSYTAVHGLVCRSMPVTNVSSQSKTFYFFATGSRTAYNGFSYRGNYGYLMTSQATDVSSVRYFFMNQNGINIDGGWVRYFAMPLLPVKDY